MLRFLKAFLMLIGSSLILSGALAQSTPLAVGDPPAAALITVSPPDKDGLVTISGAPGAVFPAAQVTLRNLYTEDVVYTQASINGSFSALLYGPGNTPFWISPAPSIPNALRDRPGSLPGGPGTIIYGPFPETAVPDKLTQLRVDGSLADWEAGYSGSEVLPDAVYALVNQDALFVGFTGDVPADYTQLVLTFTLDGALYTLTFDPRLEQLAVLRRVQPNATDLGALAVGAAQQDNVIEVRIPFLPINPNNTAIETASVERLQFLGADGAARWDVPVAANVPVLADEQSGAVHLDSVLGDEYTRFTVSGSVAQGASRWQARGRVKSLDLEPGDQLVLELDVTLDVAQFPEGLVGLQLGGALGLQPLTGAAGDQAAGGLNSNNGWSNQLTPSGLPVINLTSDVLLGQAVAPASTIIRRGNQLVFALDFALTLPDDLPAGRYVPFFRGFGQVADGEVFAWETNNILGAGAGLSRLPLTRLPLVLAVGGAAEARLVWTLFQDVPSDGSRGVLADEDRDRYALSNRVRFDAPTYILPRFDAPGGEPTAYALEPYLLNQLPNAYDTTTAPLVPFLFPGGRLTGQVVRPNGVRDDLGSAPIVQNQLSTAALDERALFGAQSPVDVYRLTTLNPLFTEYTFKDYGEHTIELSGSLEDIWGNRYDGGGTYRVLVAEPLELLPGVLPGTPFEVGDAFYTGLRVLPGGAAAVTITARIYPLDGSAMIEHVIQGQANPFGYFYGAGGFTFDTPGEYVVDYEARYTDAEGKLWAASARGAGVIATPDGALMARGQRGLDGAAATVRPAWFALNRYQSVVPGLNDFRLNYPYHVGDVVWAATTSAFNPVVQVQDRQGNYSAWLQSHLPDDVTPNGLPLPQAAAEDELPVGMVAASDNPWGAALRPDQITNNAYVYISALRPGVTARQFVAGGRAGGLPLYWDWNDPLNGQIGTGVTGTRAGDYLFLFGGAVVRNTEADVQAAAIYAALAVTIDPADPAGPRVFPPYRGQAGGANGGPLLVINAEPVEMFFHPTGVQPGQRLLVGDTLAVAGQVAPTLPSVVAVTITAPSGAVRQFEGTASRIGYFYDPTHDFEVDEAGVWTVEIVTRHEGLTSAGQIEPPPPTGGVLGTMAGRFAVYVLPIGGEPLAWNSPQSDLAIPAAFPYNFNLRFPADWSDVQIEHTVTMPGYVLESGALRAGGGSFTYQFNPANLARIFSNLESNGEGDGPAASDVVTVTLVVTGTDANGRAQIQSRSFTIMHDRLTTFD